MTMKLGYADELRLFKEEVWPRVAELEAVPAGEAA